MDLEKRKYQLIQKVFTVEEESIINELERVIENDKNITNDITFEQKKELDNRLKSYQDNPENLIDWNTVKDNW